MNQSVIFTDTLSYNSELLTVIFTAQCMGQNIECHISIVQLEQLSDKKVEDTSKALQYAEMYRFDIEEHFEDKIEAEEFDDLGIVNY